MITIAGWSSLEARKTHDLEVGGSNPSPAIPICIMIHSSVCEQCQCGGKEDTSDLSSDGGKSYRFKSGLWHYVHIRQLYSDPLV